MATEAMSRALYQSLLEWVTNRTNGVVFVTTVRKRVLCLNLTDGYITYCAGAGAHAQDAVVKLAHANVATFSLRPVDDYPFRMRDEVVHAEVLAALEDRFREAGHNAADLRPGGTREAPAGEPTEHLYVSARLRIPVAASAGGTQAAEPRKTDTPAEGTPQRFYVSARMSTPAKKKQPIDSGQGGLASRLFGFGN